MLSSFMRYASVVAVALATIFVAVDQHDASVPIGERASGVGGAILDPYNELEHKIYVVGWPVVAGSHQVTAEWFAPSNAAATDQWRIRWPEVALDVLACLSIVLCTFVVARLYLPRIRTGRCSLSLVFVFVTMSAGLAWWLAWESACFKRLNEPIARVNDAFETSIMNESISIPYGAYMPVTFYTWWIFVPVLYGMACVLFVLLRLPILRINR